MKFNIWISMIIYLLLFSGRRCGFDANRSSRSNRNDKSDFAITVLDSSTIQGILAGESRKLEESEELEESKPSTEVISYRAVHEEFATDTYNWLDTADIPDNTILPGKPTKELTLQTDKSTGKKYYQYGTFFYGHHQIKEDQYLIIFNPGITAQERVVVKVNYSKTLNQNKPLNSTKRMTNPYVVESFQLGNVTYPVITTTKKQKGKKKGNYLQHVMVHDVCGCPVTDDLTKHVCTTTPVPNPAIIKKFNVNRFLRGLHSVMQ